MAEPFKNLIHPGAIHELGTRVQAVHPSFAREAFVGRPDALAVLGFEPRGSPTVGRVTPRAVKIGDHGELSATLLADADQRWLVGWIVRAPRADGSLVHRVVKGKQRDVSADERVVVRQRLSFKAVTTRVTRPGTWQVAVQVNGEILGECSCEVTGEAQ